MQEILQKQGMIGGKQMRFRCRKTPINLLSIQVFGAGGSPQLQSKSITPSTSTQHVYPSSRYDGLSQVTVNGDRNLISSNIKSGTNIFGVTGNYKGAEEHSFDFYWSSSQEQITHLNYVGGIEVYQVQLGVSIPYNFTASRLPLAYRIIAAFSLTSGNSNFIRFEIKCASFSVKYYENSQSVGQVRTRSTYLRDQTHEYFGYTATCTLDDPLPSSTLSLIWDMSPSMHNLFVSLSSVQRHGVGYFYF